MAEPLQWRNEPEWNTDSDEFVAKFGRIYFLVRAVNEPPKEYPRENVWYLGHHTNDEFDNGMCMGFYPSAEAAKAAAQAYVDTPTVPDKAMLEELIQFKKDAGEYDEVLAGWQAEFQKHFGDNPTSELDDPPI